MLRGDGGDRSEPTVIERRDAVVDVADVGPAGMGRIATRFVVDSRRWDEAIVLCCFPGGGMSKHYFELTGFDMAGHLAAAGFGVLLVDHPGVGTSDVPDDAWSLTPEVVADLDAVAVTRAVRELGATEARLVGVGHSMGAMLVAYQQARHRPYDGLVLAGFSRSGLPQVLTPSERAVAGSPARIRDSLVALARERFRTPLPAAPTATSDMLVGPHVEPEAEAALRESADVLLAVCGMSTLIPGSDADVLAAIDVPVLYAIAEHDIVGPPQGAPSAVSASPDVTVHVVAGAFHNSNVASMRYELWDRIATWARAL
jgi:alpha-beta hydrolase superfamily lysophospholipase